MTKHLIKSDYKSLIFTLRGHKVMVDADLAVLYGTLTKVLKQQVRRNKDRFPIDFMFETTYEEKQQLVTNCDQLKALKHSSVNPMVFTEQGVAMLSSVLKSQKAISINIDIMRAFVHYRSILNETEVLKSEIHAVDTKLDRVFKFLLDKIDRIDQKNNTARKKIGY